MATQNLNLDVLVASQNDKTTSTNNALERIDQILGDITGVDVSGSSPVNLTDDEGERTRRLQLTGTLTEDMVVRFQSDVRRTPMILHRDGSNAGFTLTVQPQTPNAAHVVGEVRLRDNDIVQIQREDDAAAEEGLYPTGEPMVYIYGSAYGSAANGWELPTDLFANSQEVFRYVEARARVQFKDDFEGSEGHLGAAATAETDFDILVNGGSIGTMRFAIAAQVATFISTGDQDVVEGDVITIVAPGTADVAAADLSFILRGFRH